MRFVDGTYTYNLSAKALPHPSGTYRRDDVAERPGRDRVVRRQTLIASFGVKP
jgi:hypothetical protein